MSGSSSQIMLQLSQLSTDITRTKQGTNHKLDLIQYIDFDHNSFPYVTRNVIADRLPDMLAKSSPSQKLYDVLTVYLRLDSESFITPVIQEAMDIYLEVCHELFSDL
jgi:hypothetical protein